MKIDREKCISCRSCIIYCPVNAIKAVEGEVLIDQDLCVECGACLKSDTCEYDALYLPELLWPRILRSQFSDPLTFHPEPKISGHGTSEMKTNDVTGRFSRAREGLSN